MLSLRHLPLGCRHVQGCLAPVIPLIHAVAALHTDQVSQQRLVVPGRGGPHVLRAAGRRRHTGTALHALERQPDTRLLRPAQCKTQQNLRPGWVLKYACRHRRDQWCSCVKFGSRLTHRMLKVLGQGWHCSPISDRAGPFSSSAPAGEWGGSRESSGSGSTAHQPPCQASVARIASRGV